MLYQLISTLGIVMQTYPDDIYTPGPFESISYFFENFFIYGGFGSLLMILIMMAIPISIAIFIYTDSKKHGMENGLLWAVLGLLFWPIIVIYLLVRKDASTQEGGEVVMSLAKRGYFYVMSFIMLLILYWALADFLHLIFSSVSGTTSTYLLNAYKRDLSLRLSAVIVTLPLWLFHWSKAISKPESTLNLASRLNILKGQRSYLLVVLGLFGLLFLVFGTVLVYQMINYLLGVSNQTIKELGVPLGYGLLAGIIWLYHYLQFQKVSHSLHQAETGEPATQNPMPQQPAA